MLPRAARLKFDAVYAVLVFLFDGRVGQKLSPALPLAALNLNCCFSGLNWLHFKLQQI